MFWAAMLSCLATTSRSSETAPPGAADGACAVAVPAGKPDSSTGPFCAAVLIVPGGKPVSRTGLFCAAALPAKRTVARTNDRVADLSHAATSVQFISRASLDGRGVPLGHNEML